MGSPAARARRSSMRDRHRRRGVRVLGALGDVGLQLDRIRRPSGRRAPTRPSASMIAATPGSRYVSPQPDDAVAVGELDDGVRVRVAPRDRRPACAARTCRRARSISSRSMVTVGSLGLSEVDRRRERRGVSSSGADERQVDGAPGLRRQRAPPGSSRSPPGRPAPVIFGVRPASTSSTNARPGATCCRSVADRAA